MKKGDRQTLMQAPKNAWPALRADFRFDESAQFKEKEGRLTGVSPQIAVEIPREMFVDKASSFENVDMKSASAPFYAIGLETICYAIQVIYLRTDFRGTGGMPPLDIKLEGLANEVGEVEEYRLHIFQRENCAHPVFPVLNEILKSPSKRVNHRGVFEDLQRKAKTNPDDGDDMKNAAQRVQPRHFPTDLKAHQLYLHMHSRAMMATVWSIFDRSDRYLKKDLDLCNTENISDKNSNLYPGNIFNLANVLRETNPAVRVSQRRLSNYVRTRVVKGEETHEYVFPHPELVLNIQMEWMSPAFFMTRLFPFVQLKQEIIAHDRRIMTIALYLQERESAAAAEARGDPPEAVAAIRAKYARRRAALGGGSASPHPPAPASVSQGGDGDGAGGGAGDVASETGPRAGSAKGDADDGGTEGAQDRDLENACQGLVEQDGENADPNDEDFFGNAGVGIAGPCGAAYGGTGNYETAMHFGVSLNHFGNKVQLTPDQMQENRDLMEIFDADEADASVDEIQDYLLVLRRQVAVHRTVLRQCFKDDPARLRRELQSLRVVAAEKMESFCESSMSNVSDVAQQQNKIWEEEGLDALDSTWDPVDPKLSVMANWMIRMVEGLSECNVATQHAIIIGLYIGLGDRYRREFNLHYNAYIEGSNAVGKSALIQMVCELFGVRTTEEFTAKSSKSGAVDRQKSDVLSYCEDYSLTNVLIGNKTDGEDAIMRNLLTRMKYVYDVFEWKTSGTNKQGERTSRRVVGIEIGCQCLAGNETVEEIAERFSGSKIISMGMAAHMSRYHVIDVSQHNHPMRNIRSSMAAGSSVGATKADIADKFKKECIKGDIVRARFMRLEYIGVVSVNMKAFTDAFPKFMDYFATLGIKPESERVFSLAYLYCKQLAIMTAYHTFHNIAGAPHYGTRFRTVQMLDWVVCCTEEMAANTLAHFSSSFIPSALPSVLEALRTIKTESLAAKDGRVAWETPYETNKRRLAEDKDASRKRTAAAARDALAAAKVAADAERRAKLARDAANIARDRVANLAGNKRPHSELLAAERAAERAAKDALAFMPQTFQDTLKANGGGSAPLQPPGGPGQRDGIPPTPATDPAADPAAAPVADPPEDPAAADGGVEGGSAPPLDASWVQFRMTEDDLITQIQSLMVDNTIEYSRGALKSCLARLRRWKVKSRAYSVVDAHQKDANMEAQSPERTRMAVDCKNKEVFVNTAVLDPDFHYNDTARKCIQSVCFQHTIAQTYLLGSTCRETPWMYETVEMAPVAGKEMQVVNPNFVLSASAATMRGGAAVDAAESHLLYTYPADPDSVNLEAHVRNMDIGEGRDPLNDAIPFHPVAIKARLRAHYAANKINPRTGQAHVFMSYPKEYSAELLRITEAIRKLRAGALSADDLADISQCDILAVGGAATLNDTQLAKYRQRIASFADGTSNDAADIVTTHATVASRMGAGITADERSQDVGDFILHGAPPPPAVSSRSAPSDDSEARRDAIRARTKNSRARARIGAFRDARDRLSASGVPLSGTAAALVLRAAANGGGSAPLPPPDPHPI